MRKIAMVGTSSTGAAAPFGEPSWEIWGVSRRAAYVTRADRWFELHRLDGEPPDWAYNWRKTVREFIEDIPLYMIYPEKDLAKTVIPFPYQHMIDRFGTFFMTSTFAWMMAMAIDELRPIGKEPIPGHISIYGVEMEYGTEYRQQRAGFRHFISLAEAFGIPVTRLAEGGLAYEPIPYPMWQDDPLLAKLTSRNRVTRKAIDDYHKTLEQTQKMIAQQTAIIDLLGGPVFDKDEKLSASRKLLNELVAASASLSRDIVCNEGEEAEQRWFLDYLQH